MGKSATGGSRVLAALRAEQAIGLRIAGATYREIAGTVGISYQQAQKIVARSLDATRARTAPEVERLRELEVRRMDAVIMQLWPHRSDPKHARVIVSASERRARLLGLDAPLRLEDATPKTDDGGPRFDLSKLSLEELRQWETLMAKVTAAADAVVEVEVKALPANTNGVPKNGAHKNGTNGVQHEAPDEPEDEGGEE